MTVPHHHSAAAFFDAIAPQWDSWEKLEELARRLEEGFRSFAIRPDEHILDVGCGTGNSTRALLPFLSANGKITAVDPSPAMLAVAKEKVKDPRVEWICDGIERLDGEQLYDRILCFSVWPHLSNHPVIVQGMHRMLMPHGRVHIWHLQSREEINRIHANASDAVMHHTLAPAERLSGLLVHHGFVIEQCQDDAAGYLITGRKNTP